MLVLEEEEKIFIAFDPQFRLHLCLLMQQDAFRFYMYRRQLVDVSDYRIKKIFFLVTYNCTLLQVLTTEYDSIFLLNDTRFLLVINSSQVLFRLYTFFFFSQIKWHIDFLFSQVNFQSYWIFLDTVMILYASVRFSLRFC